MNERKPAPVLLSCEEIGISFGVRPLFEGLALTLHEGDHVGLVGPNGAGKSTLLKILAGIETADTGTRSLRKNVRAGYVPQDPVFAPGRTVEEVLDEAAQRVETLDGNQRSQQVSIALSRAGFTDRTARTDRLSGGWRKRLAVARELVQQPDILLLDEPTNHLDVEAILWLENLLLAEPKAFIAVSHDRYFLQNVARRMLELDRIHPGGLFVTDGSYADFLEERDQALSNQAAYQESLANLVRREVEWLRRGAKARTSKSRSRIQSAERMMDQLEQSRERGTVSRASIDFHASERRTKRLWQGLGLRKQFEGTEIFGELDLLLTPGLRLGVLGPNASGKTTLLRMIVGEIEPDAGEIRRAEHLRTVYFEQNRESLDSEVTLRRALAPEGDSVIYRDRAVHVATWAKRFLFRPDQLDTQVARLSGGERARIILARLMLQPADLLVLDEPTNDLDIPTLDVLEESLLEFPGALVLVTHDRYLLDRVSTRILALDGKGGAEFFADYSQWESEYAARATPRKRKSPAIAPKTNRPKSKRLSYNDQREWESMEERLLAAEALLDEARERAGDPSIASDSATLQLRVTELDAAQTEVDRLYARWAELENKLS